MLICYVISLDPFPSAGFICPNRIRFRDISSTRTHVHYRQCRIRTVQFNLKIILAGMHSINISKYTTPENYELGELPAPTVEDPKDVVIKVHAASVNPIDVKKASGVTKMVLKDEYVGPIWF